MMNLSFLRPLALPRAATLRAFLSTTTQASSASISSANTASSRSSPSHATPVITTIPLVAPKTVLFTPATQTAPTSTGTLPYHVTRTASKSLPIYLLRKRGGNLHQTKVQKISGNVQALRQELQDFLGLEKSEVVVNALTRHIIIRGHRKQQVARFLVERKF